MRFGRVIAPLALALAVVGCGSGPPESPAVSSPVLVPPGSTTPAAATRSPAVLTAPPLVTRPPVAASGARSPSPTSAPPGDSPTPAPASVGPSGALSSGLPADCAPEPPTDVSASWSTLEGHDHDLSFKFPDDWDKLYGAFVFTTSSLVDLQTFAETGLAPTHQTRADLVRAPTDGLPNASILIVPGVVSDTATVFARQVARFRTIGDIKLIATDLVACIGGQPALGVSFTFSNDTTYQESWYIVRNGRSYDIQWLAPKDDRQDDTFREILRTWQWAADVAVATPLPVGSALASPSPGASAASTFVVAGMTTKIDTAALSANPKDFVTTIPKEATSIYAVFALKPGLSGQVDGALKQGNKVLVTLSLDYTTKNTWGDFRINSANGITPGTYAMEITFAPTGEMVSLPFTVK